MATVVLASPDAAGPENMMAAIAEALALASHPVILVDLDPRSHDDATHRERLRAVVSGVRGPVILGGFSLGARIAAELEPELTPLALLGFGYPFHPHGSPGRGPGFTALTRVRAPARIIQGTRDPHGTQSEVRGYPLPAHVDLVWIPDANHRFVPRASAELDHPAALELVTRAALEFITAAPWAVPGR